MKLALAPLARARELGVVGADRGRDDDLGVRRDEIRVVADDGLESGRAKAIQIARLRAVGASDALRPAGARPAPARSCPRRRSR